jgi:hypothetical protein
MHTTFLSENLKGGDNLGDLNIDGRAILKWILKINDTRMWLDSDDSGQVPVAGSCEHGSTLLHIGHLFSNMKAVRVAVLKEYHIHKCCIDYHIQSQMGPQMRLPDGPPTAHYLGPFQVVSRHDPPPLPRSQFL